VSRTSIPVEALLSLRQRLDLLPSRCHRRRQLIEETASFYSVSPDTVYRALRDLGRVKQAHRSDYGKPRNLSVSEMTMYCEIIAAMKIRTNNSQGHHLSTVRIIELLEEYGVETPEGKVQVPKGLLSKATVNRYLKAWGYEHEYITRPIAGVRFQAATSNACWQFDLSSSDLKHLEQPPQWVEADKGNPKLMLYSVVDDRSGVCYQEYHCVYGEDVEAALRFLFNAMSPKNYEGLSLQGIPEMIYTDNGPIAKSLVFQRVMKYLDIELVTHTPNSKDNRRDTSRSKGKVERPFRTVKEAHETLYHFHKPETEEEANSWLHRFLVNYNNKSHRDEPHSRNYDWLENLPKTGLKQMCNWERFCTFAREPQKRKVDGTARITTDGISYEVDQDLAGETVTLWWGLFDNQLYVEWQEQNFGPYYPVNAPISLHTYRARKKTKKEERIERIESLSKHLSLPKIALSGNASLQLVASKPTNLSNVIPFRDPDPYQELTYPSILLAKRAIAEYLCKPLATLSVEQKDFLDTLLQNTLNKKEVMLQVKKYFSNLGE
jgi:hypothetical protein